MLASYKYLLRSWLVDTLEPSQIVEKRLSMEHHGVVQTGIELRSYLLAKIAPAVDNGVSFSLFLAAGSTRAGGGRNPNCLPLMLFICASSCDINR